LKAETMNSKILTASAIAILTMSMVPGTNAHLPSPTNCVDADALHGYYGTAGFLFSGGGVLVGPGSLETGVANTIVFDSCSGFTSSGLNPDYPLGTDLTLVELIECTLSNPAGLEIVTTSDDGWYDWNTVDPADNGNSVLQIDGTDLDLNILPCVASTGDADFESGNNGGALPGGSYAADCGFVSHHSSGPGASFDAFDHLGQTIVYTSGTDGPVRNPVDGSFIDDCLTSGIISDDETTDPDDCSGTVGYDAPPFHATSVLPGTNWQVGSGVPPAGDAASPCNGFDGGAWVLLYEGVIDLDGDANTTEDIFTSSPTTGDIF